MLLSFFGFGTSKALGRFLLLALDIIFIRLPQLNVRTSIHVPCACHSKEASNSSFLGIYIYYYVPSTLSTNLIVMYK